VTACGLLAAAGSGPGTGAPARTGTGRRSYPAWVLHHLGPPCPSAPHKAQGSGPWIGPGRARPGATGARSGSALPGVETWPGSSPVSPPSAPRDGPAFRLDPGARLLLVGEEARGAGPVNPTAQSTNAKVIRGASGPRSGQLRELEEETSGRTAGHASARTQASDSRVAAGNAARPITNPRLRTISGKLRPSLRPGMPIRRPPSSWPHEQGTGSPPPSTGDHSSRTSVASRGRCRK